MVLEEVLEEGVVEEDEVEAAVDWTLEEVLPERVVEDVEVAAAAADCTLEEDVLTARVVEEVDVAAADCVLEEVLRARVEVEALVERATLEEEEELVARATVVEDEVVVEGVVGGLKPGCTAHPGFVGVEYSYAPTVGVVELLGE